MNLFPRPRFVAVLVALVGILFMQFAVAAYVCPGLPMGQVNKHIPTSAASANTDMTGCIKMDAEQPNLCVGHAQAHEQSLDKPELPHVQAFVPVELVATLNLEATGRPAAVQLEPALLTRTTAPPLSVLHCCFRI